MGFDKYGIQWTREQGISVLKDSSSKHMAPVTLHCNIRTVDSPVAPTGVLCCWSTYRRDSAHILATSEESTVEAIEVATMVPESMINYILENSKTDF